LEQNTPQNFERIQNYTSGFGKILFCETLEAVIYINNLSDKEILIKDIKFKVSNEVLDDYESMFKKSEFYLINTNTTFKIPAGHFMHKRIKILADTMCKYIMEIDIQYGSIYYNDEFLKHSQSKIIKTISNHYYITSNPSNVIAKFFKKFLFSTNLPFKIKDKIITNNLEKSFIEVNLTNPTPYNLNIRDIALIVDQNANQILLSEKSNINKDLSFDSNSNLNTSASNLSQEIVRNDNNFFYSNKNCIMPCYIEPEEEINFSFTLMNYKAFINSVSYL